MASENRRVKTMTWRHAFAAAVLFVARSSNAFSQEGGHESLLQDEARKAMITYNQWILKEAGYPVEYDGSCGVQMAKSTLSWLHHRFQSSEFWFSYNNISIKNACDDNVQILLKQTYQLQMADRI